MELNCEFELESIHLRKLDTLFKPFKKIKIKLSTALFTILIPFHYFYKPYLLLWIYAKRKISELLNEIEKNA